MLSLWLGKNYLIFLCYNQYYFLMWHFCLKLRILVHEGWISGTGQRIAGDNITSGMVLCAPLFRFVAKVSNSTKLVNNVSLLISLFKFEYRCILGHGQLSWFHWTMLESGTWELKIWTIGIWVRRRTSGSWTRISVLQTRQRTLFQITCFIVELWQISKCKCTCSIIWHKWVTLVRPYGKFIY